MKINWDAIGAVLGLIMFVVIVGVSTYVVVNDESGDLLRLMMMSDSFNW